jgi:hypothetical protein
MAEVDLFILFRTALFVFLTTYAVLVLISLAWRLRELLGGADQRRQTMRLYVSYQLATIRVKPLRGELVQIGFWLAALGILWWLHRFL